MTKISGSTFYFKKVFPTFWFGFLALFLVTARSSDAPSLLLYAVPILMALFGFFLFRKLVWDLADEVYDAGDHLIFRKGGKEQRVRLEEIINIDYAYMLSPERVTIHSRTAGPIGKELVFCLPLRLNPFARAPVVAKLIERVDHARRS